MSLKRIAILTESPANAQVFAEELGVHYEVATGRPEDVLTEAFDLGVIDGSTLGRLGAEVRARREADGALLPFLLVTPREDMQLTAAEALGKSVDELISAPVETLELRARVESLLRARELALESEARYHALAAHAPVGVAVMSEGRIRYANPVLVDTLACSAQELEGTELGNYFEEAYRESLNQLVAEPAPARGEMVEATTLTQRELELRAASVPYGGGPAALVVAVDVTARRLAEEKRCALERRLVRAERFEALGRLAGGIAHDFNNLLTILNSYGGLIQEDQRAGKVSAAEDVDELLGAVERSKQLVGQLLSFSRHGHRGRQRQLVDPRDVIRDFGKMLDRLAGDDVRVDFEFQSGDLAIDADPGQLEQVLSNLVLNARDAMTGAGRVAIAVSYAEVGTTSDPDLAPGAYVRIAVTDTGMGMDEMTRARVFEPFFSTKGDEGTGLGLATVFGIVTANGAAIRVDSAPGRGTTFDILWPEAAAAA